MKPKRVLYFTTHRLGRSPGQRFRFEQYLDYLAQHGCENTLSNLLSERNDVVFYKRSHYLKKFIIFINSWLIRIKDIKRIKEFDLVFIYRECIMSGSTFFERKMKKAGTKMILDFDDAIWLYDVSEGNRKLGWMKRPSKTEEIIRLCDRTIVGNNYLADYARQFSNNVVIIPTTLDTELFKRIEMNRNKNLICIGWTGSSTTMKHFALAVPFLKKIQNKFQNKIYIKLISDVSFITIDFDIKFCKWNKETEVEDLCEIDVGIMPLPDDEWARGKCGFKGLQYMSLEIPTVMSPVGVNTEIIQDGENGFLASTDEEWVTKISALIESPELRERLGKAGRKTVVEKYSFEANKEKWLQAFHSVLNDKSS